MKLTSSAKEIGLAPGSLVHVGEPKVEQPQLKLIDYGPSLFETIKDLDLQTCAAAKERDSVSWINLTGLHQVERVRELGELFDIHPLALEDILNTRHQPKYEEYEDHILMIFNLFHLPVEGSSLQQEQISMVIGTNWLLTFQEIPEDIFDQLRARLERANGRIRQRGPDYLAYAILDSVVDSYQHLLSDLEDRLEALEETVLSTPESEDIQAIHNHRRELMALRRSLRPLQIAINEFSHSESSLLQPTTQPFLRDLRDHINLSVDTLELIRDANANLLDLYLSLSSQKLNETMKVLTIMASIFIPLTFIAGIYGMNFEQMPELKWRWGYPATWLVMIACAAGLLWYFRRKKWF